MFKILGSLLGLNKASGRTPVGQLAVDIRQAIKGKEIDPQKAIELIHELNKAEAEHRSVFVAGWRPAIGWTGAIVLFYHYVAQPLLVWILHLNGITELPPTLDLDQLWPIISGMLGIAGMRSYDKAKGKS